MFCIHCGTQNPEDASFCSTCGKSIGAAEEAPRRAPDSAEKSSVHAAEHALQQMSLPVQPQQVPYQPAAERKSRPVLWILAGFAACLLIVITVALGFRLSQASPVQEAPRANPASDAAPPAVPVAEAAPAAPPATDNTPAPVSAPVQAPPPPPSAAPQNPIVGDWKATTFIGSTIGLHLGADGRYVLNPGSDEGVYVFSSGDGTLRLQSNSFFSKGIMIWSCQLSGDSLSCVDPAGAGHVYTRIR